MIYDVTVAITGTMPVWPTDPPVKLTPKTYPSKDKSYTIEVTAIEMGSHTGTHVDAPAHFIKGGKKLNEIPLDLLIGPARVVQIAGVRSIQKKHLEGLDWDGTDRVLFKTDNSDHWTDGSFYPDFVYIEPEAAEFLVLQGIRLVGIDYLSVDQFGSEKHPTHFVLLKNNAVILEGLDLSLVTAGRYRMVALPLNLDGDGAPTRVILTEHT